MSIGCVAIAGRPQDVVSSSGALWGHQTAETARGRKWCIRYRITRLRNSVLSIANAPTGESSVLLCSPVRSVSTSGTVEIEARLSERARTVTEAMTLNRLIYPLSEHAMPKWIRRTALGDILKEDFSKREDES